MAGKIPQAFIDDLLERSDIVELIDSRVKLKKTGRNYQARCPFHDEKTPSFSVNPDKQFYYCFGCGAGGNAISFLMDYDRNSFVETIENLAQHLGISVPREDNPQLEKQQQAKRSIYDLLEQSSQFYQQQLRQHGNKRQAIDYLKLRGLSSETVQQYGIGYAPPGWDNLLKALGDKPESAQLLADGGMLIEKDNNQGFYDRFRERLIFPIRDNRGRTIGFGGRVFNDDKPKYLNSPETAVFHKQMELYGLFEARKANRHLERLLMVEGYMDVVALAQNGINWAVATLGTAAGTAHMEKVFRHCNEVIFCFDGDTAGRKAADRALDAVLPLMQPGRQAKFLLLEDGDDPDTLVRRIGTEQFLWQVDQAPSLSQFLFSRESEKLDLSRPDDRALLINQVSPKIACIPEGALKSLILKSLSEKTGLSITDINQLQAQTAPKEVVAETEAEQARAPHEEAPKKRAKLSKDERSIKRTPARAASAMLLLRPQILHGSTVELQLSEEEISFDQDLQLLSSLIDAIKKEPDIHTNSIIGRYLAQKQSSITQLLAMDHQVEGDEQLGKEFFEAIQQIQSKRSKLQRQQTSASISKSTRIDQLSPEQREQYLALFKRENSH